MTFRQPAALALLVAVSACGGLEPPNGLSVQDGASFDDLVVTWAPGCSGCGYDLEYSYFGQSQQLTETPLPAGTTTAKLVFLQNATELMTFEFRVRAAKGGDRSRWSHPVTYHRGVRPPTIDGAVLDGLGGVRLSWTNRSLVADQLRVERVETAGVVETVTALPAAFGDLALLDAAAPEAAQPIYRVRYGAGTTWSRPAELPVPTPPFQPTGVSAVVTPGGVLVTWTRRSAKADVQRVRCTACSQQGLLNGAATSWVDPVLPPWPNATYQVEAVVSGSAATSSSLPTVGLAPFRLVGAAATLDARAGPFPDSLRTRDAGGAWYEAGYRSSPVVMRHDAAGTTEQVLPGQQLLGLKQDAAGDPHVGTLEAAGPGTQLMVHHWHDALGWHREASAPVPIFFSTAWFGVDGAGEPQLAYLTQDGSGSFQVVHGIRGAAGFDWTVIPGLQGSFQDTRFTVAADGWAHATGWAGANAIASRTPGGSWSVQPLPFSPFVMTPGTGGDLAIHGSDGMVGFDLHVLYAERAGGVWGGVETVGPWLNFSPINLARTPSGGRAFMVLQVADANPTGSRLDLFARGPGGWVSMRITPSAGGALPFVGPDGRLVISGSGSVSGTGSVWEEPVVPAAP
jgi:hypothetical protein